MPQSRHDQRDLVEHYLRSNPDVADRAAASWLFHNFPGVWGSYNAVYCQVRRARGHHGKKHRKQLARMGTEPLPRIPRPAKKSLPVVRLNAPGRWLIISDLHVPYHDQRALEAAIKHGVDRKCDHLLVNGDALDAYQCSHWLRDPNQRHVDKEVEMLGEFLRGIAKLFKGNKVYKVGNHEDRITAYLWSNAPQMLGATKWDLCKALAGEMDLVGWTWIQSKQLYRLGKLHAYHGHELPRGLTNPVNVGRGLWLRTKQSGFTSHWHSTSTHVESNGSKTKTWVCFSLGCLCDLHPSYAPVNGWNHGACILDLEAGGNYGEENFRIIDGKVWG